MKKKLLVILTFICAFTLALGVMAACGGKKVTVTISPAAIEIAVGEKQRLNANVSDDTLEVKWSSDKESVATVNAAGQVEGKSVGTAKITAKAGNGSATCTVTVKEPTGVIFKVDGEIKTSLTIDWESTVTLTTETTDGSTVTNLTSDDTKVVTVDKTTGEITAVGLGTANITATTAHGNTKLPVTVIIPEDGSKYPLTATAPEKGWFYWAREDGGREIEVNGEFRDEKLTVEISGEWNWSLDSFGLVYKDHGVGNEEWHKLTLKIKSDTATVINVHDTSVTLKAGEEIEATACYEQFEGAAVSIQLAGGDNNIKLEISALDWAEFEPVTLKAPSFTKDGNNITVNDTVNTEGVLNYEIGLFDDSDKCVFTQIINGTTGTIDTSLVEGKNGTYNVKVRANGVSKGYTSSEWTAVNSEYKHTINNADVTYKLTQGTDSQKKGNLAAGVMTSGRWEYLITDKAEGVEFHDAEYKNGTVTLDVLNGWAYDCTQLGRHYSEYAAGTQLKITMTLNSSRSGKIFVTGAANNGIVELTENEDKVVEYTITQKADAATILIFLNILAEDDSEWPGKLLGAGSLGYGNVIFKVSNVTVEKV